MLLPRDRRLAYGLPAVHVAGAAYLPLDPALPDRRIETMTEDARPAYVVTTEELRDRVPDGVPTLVLERPHDDPTDDPADGAPAADGGGSLAYVMYTSGTTGQPKGVAVPRSALANYFAALAARAGRVRRQIWFPVSSIGFDSSVAELLWPLLHGAYVCLSLNDPVRLLNSALSRGRRDGAAVTHVQCTPTLLRMLVADPRCRAGLRRLRRLLVGGEPFPDDLVEDLRPGDTGPRLLNVYGPTEATVWVATSEVDATSHRPTPIGATIPNTRVEVLDDRLRPTAPGDLGEVYISGRSLAVGYWRNPAETAARFLPRPDAPDQMMYRTGDLARRGDDGAIHLRGRRDGQVKVRGTGSSWRTSRALFVGCRRCATSCASTVDPNCSRSSSPPRR